MPSPTTIDQLTIEEYMHNTSALAAGLSRKDLDNTAYISMIRSSHNIPVIMHALEKDNRAAIKTLQLNMSLVQNVLVVYAPAYTGVSLRSYANTQQPYGTFDLIEKLVADFAKYESLVPSIYIQLLNENKCVIDSNGMPHIQFWIDDLSVFESDNQEDLNSLKDQKLANVLRAAYSDDFTPKQLVEFTSDVEDGHYANCLQILNALRIARTAYFNSDSERKGEVIIKQLWGRMQKGMLPIVLLLLVIVYGLYWFYFSKPPISTTVYKSRIGDVAFVAEPAVGQKDIPSETYILMFPEEPAAIEDQTTPATDTQPEPPKSEIIIIKPGDNLTKISREYYGDGSYYSQLADFNNIQNPDLIPVGLALEIPPLEVLLGND